MSNITTMEAPRGSLAPELCSCGVPASWRVLVVEDVPSQQKLLVTILGKFGHTVFAADNGQEAIDLFRREAFDVILMDVQMPGMDGLDATRAIRAIEAEQGGHVPIVAVTAHALTEDASKCTAAGSDAYLRKPINLVELMTLLKRLIDGDSSI
jgi:two-component system sensor histidine kinase/response regulator